MAKTGSNMGANSEGESPEKDNSQVDVKEIPKCGIVMPIGPIDGCTAEHWGEVLSILKDAAKDAGFEPNLVSVAEDIGIIQQRIIQNLYSNEMVVCDVSGKNPNVMFELGLRLAFDKPTIIVKDHNTDYSFDTSPIEHLGYPRDLRFTQITSFKQTLSQKIVGTYKRATSDPENYTTFLKHFGEFKVSKLTEKDITSSEFVLKALDDIRIEMAKIRRSSISAIPSKHGAGLNLKYKDSIDDLTNLSAFQIVELADSFMRFALENKWSVKYNNEAELRSFIFEYLIQRTDFSKLESSYLESVVRILAQYIMFEKK